MIPLYLDNHNDDVFHIDEHVRSIEKREYEIEDRLASGGNAVIHQCTDTTTGTEYAIKFQLASSYKRLKRFIRETNLLKKVKHDQLMRYIDHGKVFAQSKKRNKKIPFIVMPLADSNLKDWIKNQSTPLLYEDYVAQFKGLAQALGVLHQEAVHRDIKPENILISGETWILSDFGLCKNNCESDDLTDSNEPVGPRYWMSPEAVNRAIGNCDEISKSSDVYQLCCVFWFVVMQRHPTGCICPDDWTGPKNLYDAIYPALAHNPNKRPKNGQELAALLEKMTLPSSDNQTSCLTEGVL